LTTLPILEMVELLRNSNLPASISFSAGTYLCNHVFYQLQHHLKNSKVRSGFIHVPLLDTQIAEFPGQPSMPLERMIEGIKAILELLHE